LSKDEVIAAIRASAKKLGHAPTVAQLVRSGQVTKYSLHHHFRSYTHALRECGLHTPGSGRQAEMPDLFHEWAAMARKLGRVPTITHYDRNSKYSVRPLLNRFGNWKDVALGMQLYAEENGLATEWQDVLSMVNIDRSQRIEKANRPRPIKPEPVKPGINQPRVFPDRPVFGPPLLPAALAHGPTNESGVVYLFGMLARQLGFVVTQIQTEFPDCEAMREVEPDRWQRVRIEFEYQSRNFLKHLHRAEDCDVIVCWIHNWLDCPLDVVELRSVMMDCQNPKSAADLR
jgi:hypothetical protein